MGLPPSADIWWATSAIGTPPPVSSMTRSKRSSGQSSRAAPKEAGSRISGRPRRPHCSAASRAIVCARSARRRSALVWRVITGHALRSVLPSIVNICGLQLGYLFGTALFSEVVFNWPGIGQLMYNSIVSRDVPVIQAVVLCVGAVFVLINFASDVTQAALDPRARR